jgi:hypothetical protein
VYIAVVVAVAVGMWATRRVVHVLREQDGMSTARAHAVGIGSGGTSSVVQSFASDSTLK